MALAVRPTTQNHVSRGQRPAVDHAWTRSLPSRGPVERLSAEDHQHGHDERPHHIQAPPTADLGLRTGPAMRHARGRTANQPSSQTVRQIVGVVAAAVRGRANDDGFSRLLLRADDGTRTARLVREVIFQVRAGFRDRVQQMIAHGSPPQDRRLQYEPVAGSTGQPIPRERPAVVPPSCTRPRRRLTPEPPICTPSLPEAHRSVPRRSAAMRALSESRVGYAP